MMQLPIELGFNTSHSLGCLCVYANPRYPRLFLTLAPDARNSNITRFGIHQSTGGFFTSKEVFNMPIVLVDEVVDYLVSKGLKEALMIKRPSRIDNMLKDM